MGMFDYIKDKLYCPFCGTLSEENDYQSKDMECMMDSWSIEDIRKYQNRTTTIKIYHKCNKCKKWVELNIEGEGLL